MQDHATRLVGLDGLVVAEVQRIGEQFDPKPWSPPRLRLRRYSEVLESESSDPQLDADREPEGDERSDQQEECVAPPSRT